MIKTISRLLLLSIISAVVFTSCSDESYYRQGIVTFNSSGIFFDKDDTSGSYTQSTTFTIDNVASLSINEVTEGWDVTLEFYKGIITVTRPVEYDDDNAIGEVTFYGETADGYSVSPTLDFGIVEFVDIPSSEQANSMIVTEPNKFYTFDPTFKGEESQGVSIHNVADCSIVWRTYPSPIRHVQMMESGRCGFYVPADEYDYDEDGDETDIRVGNAIVAALDSDDEILWSWHIWILEDDIQEIYFNDQYIMDRNLGALSANYADTLLNYGLYYQWGRKEPFVGPLYFEATASYSAIMMDGSSTYVPLEYEETTSTVGTMSYALENPTTFILGEVESDQDWLYSAHNSSLWNDSEKSIYDPSPKGWRVAKSTSFEGVTVADDVIEIPDNDGDGKADYSNTYAAYLQDPSGNKALFMGVGRRNYITGRIMNSNSSYEPWTGYYWTSSSASDNKSNALLFSNEELFYRDSNIDDQYPMQRANGFQIRCVRTQ